MKVDAKVILLTLFVGLCWAMAGLSLGRTVEAISAPPFLDYLFTPITTLVAAFGGSWYAFKLQEGKNQKEADQKNVNAANSVIFELTRWHKKFHALKSQFISEHLHNPWRHFLILPVAGMSLDHPNFDYDSLAFIFKSKNPNLLGTLSLAELEISSTLDVINQRSKMHVEILQPAVEKVENRLGGQFSPEEVEKHLGPRHSHTLRMLTDFIVSGVDDSLAEIRKHIDLIYAETTEIYPDHVVIGMTDPTSVKTAKTE